MLFIIDVLKVDVLVVDVIELDVLGARHQNDVQKQTLEPKGQVTKNQISNQIKNDQIMTFKN
jgi:hypothetical protein